MGNSTPMVSPWWVVRIERHALDEVVGHIAQLFAAEVELFVRLVLHEVVVVAIPIEGLYGALVEHRARPLLARLEGALDGLAALDVAQLDADLRGAAAHLDVVEVEDLPEVAVELDGDAFAQVSGRDRWVLSFSVG